MTAGGSGSSYSGNYVQIGNGSVSNLTSGDGTSSANGSITIDIADGQHALQRSVRQ